MNTSAVGSMRDRAGARRVGAGERRQQRHRPERRAAAPRAPPRDREHDAFDAASASRSARGWRRSRCGSRSPSAGRPRAPAAGWRRSRTRSAARTRPPPPARSSDCRTFCTAKSCSGFTSAATPWLNSGYCVASRSEMTSISACACWSVDARLQPGERKDAGMPAAIVGQRRRPRPHRQEDVGRLQQLKARRQDADDRVRLVVERDRAADVMSCAAPKRRRHSASLNSATPADRATSSFCQKAGHRASPVLLTIASSITSRSLLPLCEVWEWTLVADTERKHEPSPRCQAKSCSH